MAEYKVGKFRGSLVQDFSRARRCQVVVLAERLTVTINVFRNVKKLQCCVSV